MFSSLEECTWNLRIMPLIFHWFEQFWDFHCDREISVEGTRHCPKPHHAFQFFKGIWRMWFDCIFSFKSCRFTASFCCFWIVIFNSCFKTINNIRLANNVEKRTNAIRIVVWWITIYRFYHYSIQYLYIAALAIRLIFSK